MKFLTPETTSTAKLSISRTLWSSLMKELKKRGEGRRESGAFLLGQADERFITDFICYDELDATAYDTGIIVFHSHGYAPLWEYCLKNNLAVLADVHTHPGGWTGQSAADKAHPMIVQAGHVSLIVPRYAKGNSRTLRGVGFYEYLGDLRWKTHFINPSIFTLT